MNVGLAENNFLKRAVNFWPVIALSLTTVLLWLPFGLHIGYFADEWLALADIQSGTLFEVGLRPFVLLPWFVAYHLDPNTYLGINVLMLLLILGKGVVFYFILNDLDFDRLFAFGTAMLVLLYPADTGVFYIGGFTIHVSVFTFLFGLWLLIRYWKSGSRWLWIPIWIVTGLCLGLYEAAFPLFVIIPLILLYKQRKITHRVILVSLGWFVMPLVFGLRIVMIALNNSSSLSYQNFLLANDRSVGAFLASIWRVIRYTLLDTWISAFSQTIAPTGWSGFRNVFKTILGNPYWVYALMGTVVLIVTVVLIRKVATNSSISIQGYVGVALAGIGLIMLAFLPYTFSNLRDVNLRTLLHASQGAAVVLSACIWLAGLLLRRVKFVYGVALTLLVMAGMTSLLNQHHGYVVLGQSQIPFMQKLVQSAPQLSSSSAVVIVDDTPNHELESTFNQISSYLEGIIQVIYSDSTLTGIICYPNDNKPWGYYNETCQFEADQVTLLFQGSPYLSRRYDQIVVFSYSTDDGLQLEHDISPYVASEEAQRHYVPDAHIDKTSPLPIRAATMLDLAP